MRFAVVLNVASGSLIGREDVARDVIEDLKARGHEAELFADGDLAERMQRAIATKPDRLLVGGGDGTIACATNALMEPRPLSASGEPIVLAVLPLGTMNQVASDLRLPLDLNAALEVAAAGTPQAIDVGEVNGHLFLCNVVLGLPARIAQHREARRGSLGLFGWFSIARRAIAWVIREPALGVAVRLPTGWRRVRTRAVMVANNRYDDGGGAPFVRSSLADGVLTLYIARGIGLASLIHTAVDSFLHGLGKAHWMETHELTQVAITAHRKALRVMIDGEVTLMHPPLRFRVRPRALSVVVPAADVESGADAVPRAPATIPTETA